MHLDPYHFCSCVVVLTMSFPRFLFGLNCARGMKKKTCIIETRCAITGKRHGGQEERRKGKGSLREQEGGYCWY